MLARRSNASWSSIACCTLAAACAVKAVRPGETIAARVPDTCTTSGLIASVAHENLVAEGPTDGEGFSHVAAVVELRNCTGTALTIADWHDSRWPSRVAPFTRVSLAAGARATVTLDVTESFTSEWDGDHAIALRAEPGAVRGWIKLSVHTRAFLDEVAKCNACNGEFARRGMRSSLGCRCRAADKGKACKDGSECTGQCTWDLKGEEITHTDAKGRAFGYRIGMCSEFVDDRCHAIEKGATAKGPYLLHEPGVGQHWAPCRSD